MDRIRIVGGRPLQGTIPIGGAKNAALPLMAAALLTDQDLVLGNLPDLADIRTMGDLLKQLGVEQSLAGRALTLNGGGVRQTEADYDLVRKMRASIVVLGPLVARHGRARVSLPGGCAIGARPVDYHLKGLAALGAEISLDQGYVEARAPAGLKGAHFVFPNVSVGATENVLMAATLARGDSVLENVAREPEVTDLAHCLVAMGARISGIGTDTLRITGVERLTGADHHILPDRIETGTYAIAVAMTGGRVTLSGARRDLVASLLDSLVEAGADVGEVDGALTVARGSVPLLGVDVMTEPFPGFPTDLQAQF
ncbi:MAG: UDP-N-acetylglucosamine 1-carboxyvinyltransferase, partial [Alphaproteobacteria bacterium]